ncbi:MAG TPA: hypothetical protein VNJ29_03965 [Candidatus Nitrosotenuis sp.]|jgi:hypothetical protein|nr:hypothetical protein [Candidatus Nitrosotenuis sp.]
MKRVYLSFYFSTLSLGYGVDFDQDLILEDQSNTLTLSDGIQLHEISPDIIVTETNKELQKIASELSDLKETFQYIQETIALQGPPLKAAEDHTHETNKDLEQIVADLEKFLEEMPDTPDDDNKPELVIFSEPKDEIASSVPPHAPKNQSTILTKENGIATTIATAGGLAAFGVAQVFAAPVTLTIAAVLGTSALGFGGTKLHFNKDSLPSLPLPSLTSLKPNLDFLSSWSLTRKNKDDVYRPQIIKPKEGTGARVRNLPTQLSSGTVCTELPSDM